MLPYTEIEFIKFNKISYAHRHSAYNYKYELHTDDITPDNNGVATGIMEIGIVEENPLIFTSGEKEYTAEEGDVFIIAPRSNYLIHTKNQAFHRHTTTEAVIDYRIITADSPSSLSLPLIIKSGGKCDKIKEAIRRIVSKNTTLAVGNYFEEAMDYMALLMSIKEYEVQSESPHTKETPAAVIYCKMAEKYALDNISRPMKVEEIARHIGISKNYLTNIYSANRGMPITEYINRMKLGHMLELMLRFGYSARKAGEFVGMDNVNYISRIFKKYYGMTISEYKRSKF